MKIITLKDFFYKRNLATIIVTLIIFLILSIYFSFTEAEKNDKISLKSKESIFLKELSLNEGYLRNHLNNLKNNTELKTYLENGTLINSYKTPLKISENEYSYFYRKSVENKYMFISKIYKMFNNEDMNFQLFDNEKNMILTSESNFKYKDSFLEKLSLKIGFGEIIDYSTVADNIYMQGYENVSIHEKNKYFLAVINMKIGTNFISTLGGNGINIMILNKEKKVINSSYIEGKKWNNLKLGLKNKIFRLRINGNDYWAITTQLANLDRETVGYFVLLEKSHLLRTTIEKTSFILGVTIIMILMVIYISYKSYNFFLILISNIKTTLDSGTNPNENYGIQEYEEIVLKIMEYVRIKNLNEKEIRQEVKIKTSELLQLNKEISIRFEFLKRTTEKDDANAIMQIAFDEFSKIVILREISYFAVIEGDVTAKCLTVDANGITSEDKDFGMDVKFISGVKKEDMLEIENEGKGLLIFFFASDYIKNGVLTIEYELSKNIRNQKNQLKKLCKLLILSLKSSRFYEISVRDNLTGVFSRALLKYSVDNIIQKTKRYGNTFSILMIDIDFFKHINDTHGHLAGDIVLKTIAITIKNELRDADTLYRYGGEEFVVVLPETEMPKAVLVAERIRQAVELKEMVFEGETIKVTVSLGATEFVKDITNSCPDIIKAADEKMYLAKKNGRNRVE